MHLLSWSCMVAVMAHESERLSRTKISAELEKVSALFLRFFDYSNKDSDTRACKIWIRIQVEKAGNSSDASQIGCGMLTEFEYRTCITTEVSKGPVDIPTRVPTDRLSIFLSLNSAPNSETITRQVYLKIDVCLDRSISDR